MIRRMFRLPRPGGYLRFALLAVVLTATVSTLSTALSRTARLPGIRLRVLRRSGPWANCPDVSSARTYGLPRRAHRVRRILRHPDRLPTGH